MGSRGEMIIVREPYDGEWAALTRIVGHAGLSAESLAVLGAGDPRLGSAMPRRALGLKTFRKALLKADRRIQAAGVQLMLSTTVLVAVTPEGRVVGAAVVSPDAPLIQDVSSRGGTHSNVAALRGLAGIHRLLAIAVEPGFRRREVGKALLGALTWHCRLSGITLLEGRLPTRPPRAAQALLSRGGFTIAEPGASLDVSRIFGIPAVLTPESGERLSYLDLQNPGTVPWEIAGLAGPPHGLSEPPVSVR